MLDPRSRTLLFEALRPPDGYALHSAVGTTYSLDLMALLAAPLAFTVFDCEDREGRVAMDPLVLLEALREHARRVTIFCQAGRIAVPPQHRPLLGYLEGSVVEAAAPDRHGSFHPKVWALRYECEDEPVRYRLLCLSRNLTFDRSWDTALVLEGELRERVYAIADNHPIGDFFKALPGMAVRPVAAEVAERLDRIQMMGTTYTLPHLFGWGWVSRIGLSRPRMRGISCQDAPASSFPVRFITCIAAWRAASSCSTSTTKRSSLSKPSARSAISTA
jgi:hypothetical protein